ncbi:hypothetical protein [Alkalihalobacillus sp. R86527]|uniref:hypothetical protein n=1 Tax=Alkalihalobacillus sp. R86527 TaxID=3093863 RepID=UPI00366A7C90
MRRLHPVHVGLFSMLMISLVVMVLLVYTDTDSTFGMVTVIGCLVYFFLYVVYLAILALLKTIRMDRDEKKERLFKFLAWFVALSVIDVATSLLASSEIRPLDFFVSFGLALGITFFDVL